MQEQPQRQYRMAIRRPVTMAMLFLTLIVFGWRSYQNLPINLMPDISYPTLTVRTEYEGAAPADVEKLVTRPLEEMLSIVSGMVEINSVSSPGLSEIILEFTWGTDMNVAMQDVRDRLDLFDPPKEVTEKPVILRYDPTLDPVMRIAITPAALGEDADAEAEQQALTEIREAAERHLKSDLEAQVGIAQVAVKGGREKEIQVLVDTEVLKSKGLSLQQVENALAQQNINLSGGRLQEGKTEYLVRTLNQFESLDEIRRSVVSMLETGPVYLEEVARIQLGAKERETIVHINGLEAVELDVFKEGDANTVQVCEQVKDLLGFRHEETFWDRQWREVAIRQEIATARLNGQELSRDAAEAIISKRERAATLLDRLPGDVNLSVITDQSRFIQDSINEVRSATIVGGGLALIVLFLFLHELKSTLLIGISIPISVVATFLPMFMRGISLNIMSLGGLALGVGMLVDNSIVVLESIFRCKEEGDGPVDAAERGAKEVSSAVISSTLTTVCVFFPIAFVEGIAGQLFSDLALTVTFSLLASLLVALYLIPMVYSRQAFAVAGDRDVVWILRGYHELRREQGKGRAASLVLLPIMGLRYIREYLVDSFKDIFQPTVSALRRLRAQVTAANVLSFLGAVLFLPFLLVLYPLQVVLRAAITLLVTVLFFVCVVLFGFVWVIRSILGALLWLPVRLFDFGFNAFRASYAFTLRHALRLSPVILLGVLALSVHASYVARNFGQELIPAMKQGEFGIRFDAPPGTRLAQTEERARRVEQVVRAHPLVESVTVEIGSEKTEAQRERGENMAQFTVRLKNPTETAPIQDQITEDLRARIAAVVTPDEKITFTLPTMFSFKTAVEVQIIGDDMSQLKELGREALARIDGVAGLKDAELSVQEGYPELIITFDRPKLAAHHLTPGQVAERLRREVAGVVATKFDQEGEKIDVRVRTMQEYMSNEQDLAKVAVTDGFPPVPLSAVATIRKEKGPSEIRRIDQRQVVLITANVEGRDLGAVSNDIRSLLQTVQWPKDYYYELGGQNRELEVSYQSLNFALALAIFLVYVVMACQFESILHPLLVMFSVPLAFVGVVYALWWTGIDLSIMVFLGGIILAGIVVNNAIVLVDYVNQLRERGMTKREAVVAAGTVRLRPILMTTITTVLGLIPMVTAAGEGAELRQPLAVVVIAGLSSSTLLTLFIMPMVYDLFGGRDKT